MGDRLMSTEPRRATGGLGRGLTALIPSTPDERPREILIAQIQHNPYQPRQRFEPGELGVLAASIAAHGVLQPILVTQVPGGYQLVAGQRRLLAAEMAGLDRVPALVRGMEQQDKLALALVENLQRADLNAMDEARAFRQLADEFGLTQEEIAARVGRSRPSVTNTLRLLDASAKVQAAVTEGRITEGHARAIVGLEDVDAQETALSTVLARGLSVRETEALVRERKDRPGAAPKRRTSRDPELERVEAAFRAALATKVTVTPGGKGGRITIEYYDADDLGRIYERLAVPDR